MNKSVDEKGDGCDNIFSEPVVIFYKYWKIIMKVLNYIFSKIGSRQKFLFRKVFQNLLNNFYLFFG